MKKKPNAALRDFMEAHKMRFHGFGGLCISGLVVYEFGYLLRYLSKGDMESFDDFRRIKANRASIFKEANQELMKGVLREEEVYQISRKQAKSNIQNLKNIVDCICGYVEICDQHGLDLADGQTIA